jgi:hypothetical protein
MYMIYIRKLTQPDQYLTQRLAILLSQYMTVYLSVGAFLNNKSQAHTFTRTWRTIRIVILPTISLILTTTQSATVSALRSSAAKIALTACAVICGMCVRMYVRKYVHTCVYVCMYIRMCIYM